MNEKKIIEDLLKQSQEDVEIWKDLYNQEKEKNKKIEKIINNLAKAVKFMGTNDKLTVDDIIKMFSPEEIKMDFNDYINKWESEQYKESKLKDRVIDMMVEDICIYATENHYSAVRRNFGNDSVYIRPKETMKEYYFKKARGGE